MRHRQVPADCHIILEYSPVVAASRRRDVTFARFALPTNPNENRILTRTAANSIFEVVSVILSPRTHSLSIYIYKSRIFERSRCNVGLPVSRPADSASGSVSGFEKLSTVVYVMGNEFGYTTSTMR